MFHCLIQRSLILLSFYFFTSPVLAQIASDGSLSVSTTVNSNNNLDFNITNGTQVGQNLYHSFSEFSVPTGGSAVFLNNANIVNIFSRVTGQNISNIDGLIQTNGNASLFLLNSNGIIFGNNASLNIGGSFITTTAESLVFQDGKVFSSIVNQSSPLLSINLPIGLQFGQQAQPIQVQALADQLVVKPQNTLALLGGDITIIGSPLPTELSNHLTAPSGRVEIGSVDGGSFVTLISTVTGWQFGYEQIQQFRDINISNEAILGVSDFRRGAVEMGGGSIQVTGRNITLTEGASIFNLTLGEQAAGDIIVNASDKLFLTGFQEIGSSSIATVTAGNGNAGNIEVNTQSLIIENGAGISSQAFENASGFSLVGNSGNIIVNATESIEIRGSNLEVGNSQITVRTRTAGNAGNIDITTKRLTITDGAEITASTVPPPNPSLVNSGQGGTININATEFINVQGTGQLLEITPFFDDEGYIIDVREMTTTIPSRIIAETQGAGNGGNINLTTGQLILQNQPILENRGTISTSGTNIGNAGNININANSIFINNQGLISAESNSGEGGNMNLQASDFILLRNNIPPTNNSNPYISAEAGVEGGAGNGGNITINTPFLGAVPTENMDIVANAGRGDGGNIDIQAFGIFGLEERATFTPLSDINASSEFGTSGVVSISRTDIEPQDSFVRLTTEVVDPRSLVVQQCGVGGEYAKGQFIITGKSGLPFNPLEYVDNIQGLVDLRTPEPSETPQSFKPSFTSLPIPQPIVEAQRWIRGEDGKITLTASKGAITNLNLVNCSD